MKNSFGDNIRRYRESLGMSQIKFAEKISAALQEHGKSFDYTNRSISKWENGDTMPSLDVVLVVSEMTGIGLDELFKNDIAEFKKRSVKRQEIDFRRYYDYGEVYDLKYLFVKEAIKNIFRSNYDPHGIFRANTMVIQKTELPVTPKKSFEEYAENFRKNPPLVMTAFKYIDDETIMRSYNGMEDIYKKFMDKPLSYTNFGDEIIQLDTLLRQEWLHGKISAIAHNYDKYCLNGKFLTEGQPPFIDDRDDHKMYALRYAYSMLLNDISFDRGSLLLSAITSNLFSSQNAQLKQRFRKECPNQLRARENLMRSFPEVFKSVNTSYFIFDNNVYAKHSMQIEMPTADYEKLYRDYMSFIADVPLVKEMTSSIGGD